MATAFFIQGDGNVGIGTTTPATKLQIYNGIQTFQQDTSAAGGSYGSIDSRYANNYNVATRINFVRPVLDWGDEAEIQFRSGRRVIICFS